MLCRDHLPQAVVVCGRRPGAAHQAGPAGTGLYNWGVLLHRVSCLLQELPRLCGSGGVTFLLRMLFVVFLWYISMVSCCWLLNVVPGESGGFGAMRTRRAAAALMWGRSFGKLNEDAWQLICEALGEDSMQAERTCKSFLLQLRNGRCTLQLPNSYILTKLSPPDDASDPRSRDDFYADACMQMIHRYPRLRELDVTKVWAGPMSWDRPSALSMVMYSLNDSWCRRCAIAPQLQHVSVLPNTSLISRYQLETVRGIKMACPLSFDVMAFLAAGNAYGYCGSNTSVKFDVETNDLSNKAHYYVVRATTSGGSEFEIRCRDITSNLDDTLLSERFFGMFPESDIIDPDQDFDYEHPQFQEFVSQQASEFVTAWKDDLARFPFNLLLEADNGCKNECCKVELVKKGEDYRLCGCENSRPVFVGQEAAMDFPDRCVCSQEIQAFYCRSEDDEDDD